MIIDLVANIEQYKALGKNIATAIDFIRKTDFKKMKAGKYSIDGNAVFAMVNEYNTKAESEAKPETHKRYADIQLMVEGTEYMGYLPFTGQAPSIAYNAEKDIEFYQQKCNLIEVKEGMFAVFSPQDIHQPGVSKEASAPVKKVVIKVRV